METGALHLPEVVQDFLQRIESLNGQVNAFTTVQGEQALADAERIQKKIRLGQAGRLAGAVMGVKEVLCQKGLPATCASNMLRNYEAVYNATVIERLLSEDAIILGRLNMDEFAMGSSSENSIYGPVRNPHDTTRVAGGSSGGSTASVAADMCHASLGTDTGGSIRQPASYCGVVGLKPSYGRVSRYGLIAYASSFDSIGPVARTVTDAALILGAIAGRDPFDSTSSPIAVPDYTAYTSGPPDRLRVGIPAEYFSDGLDDKVRERVMQVAGSLEKKGAQLVDITLPHLEYAIAAYYILATAEASSNLARYDGIRYGHRADLQQVLDELRTELETGQSTSTRTGSSETFSFTSDSPLIRMYKKTRTEGFGPEVKRRIMLGTYVLSAGYYDAYYAKAQRIRRLIRNDFDEAFSRVDVILSPTAPGTAFELGSRLDDPLKMYLNDIYTISANLAGICGISVPVGPHPADGLPVGAQLMARAFDEPVLLGAARLIEQEWE